jgi:hypothetical protein
MKDFMKMNTCLNPKDEKKAELLGIIQGNRLTAVFQPIIDLKNGNVYAYEALCRIQTIVISSHLSLPCLQSTKACDGFRRRSVKSPGMLRKHGDHFKNS